MKNFREKQGGINCVLENPVWQYQKEILITQYGGVETEKCAFTRIFEFMSALII